jgi:DNA-binding response OmpR family regulator
MDKVKIMLAEDDINLGSLLKQYFIAKNYDTDLYPDGEKAFQGFIKHKYDICIVDVMMPKKDGFTLAAEMKQVNKDIPVIFLTAKTLKEDVLQGFKIGADDYITKPFNMDELLLRIEAILRRIRPNSEQDETQIFNIGIFYFDVNKQTLGHDNDKVKLTTKESELLKLLCNNQNKVLERNFALNTIWEDDNYFNARSMDVYITKLRKHLKADPRIQIINVHGKGYKLITNADVE